MDRRKFIQSFLAGALTYSLNNRCYRRKNQKWDGDNEENPLYDESYFAASPRISFDKMMNVAYLSVLPLQSKNLEMELFIGKPEARFIDSISNKIAGPVIVNNSIDFPIHMGKMGGPSRLKYQFRYREQSGQDRKKWKYSPIRSVSTPYIKLKRGDRLKILLIADDHTADDADIGNRKVFDEKLIQDRLTGDYINTFVKKLLEEPNYKPAKDSEEAKMPNGWSIARALMHILKYENPQPHAIILMGDTNPLGFYHKWAGLGLPSLKDSTRDQLNTLSKIFHIYQRKKFSLLSSSIPIYLVKGNHDAEQGFIPRLRALSVPNRIKYWVQPKWGQDAHEQNYFPLLFGPLTQTGFFNENSNEDVMLMILDSESYLYKNPQTIENFTLGEKQKYDIKNLLKNSANVQYKLALMHRLTGGMFGGPDGDLGKRCYARGPLTIKNDYQELKELGMKYLGESVNHDNVEQVELTKMFMDFKVNEIVMGHDHIYYRKKVQNKDGKLNLTVAGSTKHIGETYWWDEKYRPEKNDFFEGMYSGQWQYFYGDHGGIGENSGSKNADFWGPSGYVRLCISSEGIKSEYVRTYYNYPDTNIPTQYHVGDVLPDKYHFEFPRKGPFGK
jgi:3',5'-cyclic AMP phosphodiesterase CpdA